MKKLIGSMLCIFIMCLSISVSSAAIIGSTSYGYVEKFTYGNPNSSTKITLITGVHHLEKEFGYDIVNVVKTDQTA